MAVAQTAHNNATATAPVIQPGMESASNIKIHQTMKSQRRSLKAEMREREREAYSVRKSDEKAARLASREERKQRKLSMRRQREEYAQQQKEAALRRAAELVQSNRVPIEITRGAAAAQAAANEAVANAMIPAAEQQPVTVPAAPSANPPAKKGRSSIVISTASDLDQIVTHSNNLWAKYNAIAKEHNQKVNWIVVAKELGIHVKVREKYARMHARANSRGFDFVNWGSYRIKDYPQYFLDPIGPNQGLLNVVPAPADVAQQEAVAAAMPLLQLHEQPSVYAQVPLIQAAIDGQQGGDANNPALVQPSVYENADVPLIQAAIDGQQGGDANNPALVAAVQAVAESAAMLQQIGQNNPQQVSGDEANGNSMVEIAQATAVSAV